MLRTPTWLKALFITGYKPTQSDFTDVFDSFQPVSTTKAGTATANGGLGQVITLSTPAMASGNYSLQTDDHGKGLGIEVVAGSKTTTTFTINSNEAGDFDYTINLYQ